jgi:hypothetical protein
VPNAAVGTRVDGKRMIRERWYECAILGEHVPESQTVVPQPPHPHAYQRVCLKCFDEPDYAMRIQQNPPRPSNTEGEP